MNALNDKVVEVRSVNNTADGYRDRNPMTLILYIFPHRERISYNGVTVDDVKFVTFYFKNG